MGPSLVWRSSCICDTINNGYYNGVPVSDKDPAQVCITKTSGTSLLKNLPAMQEPWFNPWAWRKPWRREWQPAPVFLPREFHGQRSLVGYSPWGHEASDMTEQLILLFFTFMVNVRFSCQL